MTELAIGIADTFLQRRAECDEALARYASDPEQSASCDRLLVDQACGRDLARLIRDAAALQDPARKKLSADPNETVTWWVTSKSLQQATPWQVARLKASWFGEAIVHDVCCGIGGDAIQLAARGQVIAVELDPLVAAFAEANLDRARHSNVAHQVLRINALDLKLPQGASLHIDPDRRPHQRRTCDPGSFAPAWDHVVRMIKDVAAAVIKLAPASEIPDGSLASDAVHRCWIELSGSVREQALLWGDAIDRAELARGERSAWMVRADGSVRQFAPGSESVAGSGLGLSGSDARPPAAAGAGARALTDRSVLIDPRAAIRAAGLTEAFAHRYQLAMLNGPAGFLVADRDVVARDSELSELAAIGEVEWWGTCDDRKLRKAFRQRNVYPETIKVRGTDHDPASLVKRYRDCGERPVRLWIGRNGQRVFAAMTG